MYRRAALSVCGKAVHRRTPQAIIDEVMKLDAGTRVVISANRPAKKGEHQHIPEQYSRQGFARARVDGVVYSLDEFPELQKSYKHDIEIVVDRLALNPDAISRVTQSVEQALEISGGIIQVLNADTDEIHTLSQRYACVDHPAEDIPELEPRLFSFNSPQGACPTCTGLGSRLEVDPDLVFNPNLTIAEGAIRPYNR